jgi:Domain of unknown function (DUF4340)
MDRRLTLVLLLVLAAVGGAAWWLERPGQAPAATATPSSAPLWTLESTDVVKVTLEDTHAHSVIELDRQADGTWSIVRPSQQAADTGAVELAVGQIAKMSIITDLGTELRIENFGVDKPAFRITLTTADTAYTLEVGSATVTGSGYYVRKQGDARVVVVGTYALDSILGWAQNLPLPATATPPPSATVEPTATLSPTGTDTEQGTPGPATATAAATP